MPAALLVTLASFLTPLAFDREQAILSFDPYVILRYAGQVHPHAEFVALFAYATSVLAPAKHHLALVSQSFDYCNEHIACIAYAK